MKENKWKKPKDPGFASKLGQTFKHKQQKIIYFWKSEFSLAGTDKKEVLEYHP